MTDEILPDQLPKYVQRQNMQAMQNKQGNPTTHPRRLPSDQPRAQSKLRKDHGKPRRQSEGRGQQNNTHNKHTKIKKLTTKIK